jgi:hypothetical protein
MSTIYDTTDTNSVLQLAWPLPGTLLTHAHLTWDEWVTRMAEELPSVSVSAIRTASGVPDSIRYLEQNTAVATLPSWPLPATGLPNFRISWAEWVDMLTGASSSRPSQTLETPSRAA